MSPPAADPAVSVIVPCYNYGHFLPQALASIREQTRADFECIVVDDGSTDDSLEIGHAFARADSRISCVTQPNRGLGAARNRGVELARGRYLQFLDADDLLEPEKLRLHANLLDCRPDVGIVYGSVRYFTSDDPAARRRAMHGPDKSWMPCVQGEGLPVVAALLEGNIMVVNAVLLRRSVMMATGPFVTNRLGVEDYDYWFRCALRGVRFEYCDADRGRALVRAHSTSMSTNLWLMRLGEWTLRREVLRQLPVSLRPRARLLLGRTQNRLASDVLTDFGRLGYTARIRRVAQLGRSLRSARWSWVAAMSLVCPPALVEPLAWRLLWKPKRWR